jgi:hypothetical protein
MGKAEFPGLKRAKQRRGLLAAGNSFPLNLLFWGVRGNEGERSQFFWCGVYEWGGLFNCIIGGKGRLYRIDE